MAYTTRGVVTGPLERSGRLLLIGSLRLNGIETFEVAAF